VDAEEDHQAQDQLQHVRLSNDEAADSTEHGRERWSRFVALG
jgi:hypothetical protein